MYELAILYKQVNRNGNISFKYLNTLITLKYISWIYSNVAKFKLHIENSTLELFNSVNENININDINIMDSITKYNTILQQNNITDIKEDILELNTSVYPYTLSDRNIVMNNIIAMDKFIKSECAFNELLHTNKHDTDIDTNIINFMDKSTESMIDMYIKCLDKDYKDILISDLAITNKSMGNLIFNDMLYTNKNYKDLIIENINMLNKEFKEVLITSFTNTIKDTYEMFNTNSNILLNKQHNLIDTLTIINTVIPNKEITLSELSFHIKSQKELDINTTSTMSRINKEIEVSDYDNVYDIATKELKINNITIETYKDNSVTADLLLMNIIKIEEDFTDEMDKVPTFENSKDILNIPDTDYDYTMATLYTYDENGMPTIPVDKLNMSSPKIRVQMPSVYYISKYSKVGITDTLINVNAFVVRDIIMLYHYTRKRYMDNLMAADPRESAEFMLDKLYESVGTLKDIYGELLFDAFDKVFRLVRWYSASYVMRYSEFWLIRDYGCYNTPLYLDNIKSDKYITKNESFEFKPGKLSNRLDNAVLELTYDSYINEQFTLVVTTDYNGSVTNNATVTINKNIIDGVPSEIKVIELATNEITLINEPMPIGNHVIVIESKNIKVNISTIKYGGCIFKSAETEYIKNSADGLMVIKEIEDELIRYWKLHHSNKTKGNVNFIVNDN